MIDASLFHFTIDATHVLVEEGYWGSSPCSSDSHNGRDCSPNSNSIMHRTASPFHQYAPVYYPQQYEHTGKGI